jgi:hypothetical protein
MRELGAKDCFDGLAEARAHVEEAAELRGHIGPMLIAQA